MLSTVAIVAMSVVGALSSKVAVESPPSLNAGVIDATAWNRTINVPYTHQPNDYTCGPSSLTMLLNFANTSTTVSAVCKIISCGSGGIGEEEFITVAKHYGYHSAYWATDDEHATNVKAQIAIGRPVATHMLVGPKLEYCSGGRAYEGTYGHYIVVNGLVESTTLPGAVHCVVSNDPAREKNTGYLAVTFWEVWTSPYGKYRYFVLGTK